VKNRRSNFGARGQTVICLGQQEADGYRHDVGLSVVVSLCLGAGPQGPRKHVAKPERLTDDAETGFQDGLVQVQPIELWAAIYEVVDAGCRATLPDILRIRRRHGGIVNLGQLRQAFEGNRARNNRESHIVQVLEGTRR
jgi:hypothetical protein